MILIFFALILVAVATIFQIKLSYGCIKQFKMYDREHSDVSVTSAEDFVSKVNATPNLEVSNIKCNGNLVNLVYQKNEYVINIENGVAFIKYDTTGCGIKLSKMGRILKMFKVSKAAKKATLINFVMDCISGKNDSEHIKEYKKIQNDTKALYISLISMLLCLIIGVISCVGDTFDKAISKVKATEFVAGVTYEEVIDGYLETSEWTAFNSDTSTAVVEIKGVSIEDEIICIQFLGNFGMGFTDGQDFTLNYFEVNGESLDPIAAMEYIYEYLNN